MCKVNANDTLVQIAKEMIDDDSFRRSSAMCLKAFHSNYVVETIVESRFNEPLYNEVLDITNDFLYPW